MYTQTYLVLGTLTALATALPHQAPKSHQLAKRDLPTFSLWADGDPNQPILTAAISDAITLAAGAQDQTTYQSIWDKYFPSTAQAQALSVFQQIVPDPSAPGSGSATLADCVIMGIDLDRFIPIENGGRNCAQGYYAYTVPWPAGVQVPPVPNPASLSYYCDAAYAQPNLLSDISCDALGDTMSQAMDALGATVLHEWMHSDNIGLAGCGTHITDYNGDAGYGVYATRQILQNDPDAALTNSDSYVWLALEIYWTQTCGISFNDPVTLNNITCDHAADPDGAEGYCADFASTGWCDCGSAGLFPLIPSDQPAGTCGYTVAPVLPTDWSPPSTGCDYITATNAGPTCGPYDTSSDDVSSFVANLTSLGAAGTMCCSNFQGGCANVVDASGGALDLCANGTTPLCIDCGTLAAYTTNLASACASGGLAGGIQDIAEVPGLSLQF